MDIFVKRPLLALVVTLSLLLAGGFAVTQRMLRMFQK